VGRGQEGAWPLEEVLTTLTSTPAAFYGLSGKGSISPGKDADLLVLSKDTLEPLFVVARGKVVKTPAWTKKGMFE
jgi:beta-aspartyl-dipeptidase (metallo-type)